ncbi:DUF5333 family protein [Poseidonocella sp. HB161398]|uniref:DUF5333 family protein n=1 Tax=Poseidonocella sp. HB161398 TaxID=2320855 RepID=UPI001109A0D0|nr:DUF5333 family protein [Poseidonocella sp. HB161398]
MSPAPYHFARRGLRLAPLAGLAGIAGCVAATPLVAPLMQKVLVETATAQFVGDTCPGLGFRSETAKTYIANAYKLLVAQGQQPEAIEAQTREFESQQLEAQVAARLEAGGVNPADPDPENVCAFGESEQGNDSLLGRLLK